MVGDKGIYHNDKILVLIKGGYSPMVAIGIMLTIKAIFFRWTPLMCRGLRFTLTKNSPEYNCQWLLLWQRDWCTTCSPSKSIYRHRWWFAVFDSEASFLTGKQIIDGRSIIYENGSVLGRGDFDYFGTGTYYDKKTGVAVYKAGLVEVGNGQWCYIDDKGKQLLSPKYWWQNSTIFEKNLIHLFSL